MLVNALMLPQFDNLDIILWCRAANTKLNSLDILYKKVAKIALDVHWQEPSVNVYRNMKWLPLHLRRQHHLSTYICIKFLMRLHHHHSPVNFLMYPEDHVMLRGATFIFEQIQNSIRIYIRIYPHYIYITRST